MGKIKKGDFLYPYFLVELPEERADSIGINLKKLILYIGKNINCGRRTEYANAHKAIRERAKRCYWKFNYSKREIKSLYSFSIKIISNKKYIKIPYKSFYIFEAIFDITKELKEKYPLDSELEKFIGLFQGDCFYNEQIMLFKAAYNNIKNGDEGLSYPEHLQILLEHLNDDLCSDASPLKQRF